MAPGHSIHGPKASSDFSPCVEMGTGLGVLSACQDGRERDERQRALGASDILGIPELGILGLVLRHLQEPCVSQRSMTSEREIIP